MTAFPWGNILDEGKANCKGFYGTKNDAHENPNVSTTPVERYIANPWGFYDMHGNVSEWCEDRYAEYNGDAENPCGAPLTSEYKYNVLRGGSCFSYAHNCRSASRDRIEPSRRDCSFGFRLCCEWLTPEIIGQMSAMVELLQQKQNHNRREARNQRQSSSPPDSGFSTGKKDEYCIDGSTFVDVSNKGLLGGMLSSFFAGLNGKGIVTGWDKETGTWDAMKEVGKNHRRRRK